MATPTSFNIETAAQDFAGEGRTINIENTERPERTMRRMQIAVNGWVFSVIWGHGAYCTGARAGVAAYVDHPPAESPDAEIAVWRKGDKMIELHGDTVEGWVSPESLLAAVAAAERDDEDGIRAALVRTESVA